MLMRFMIVLKNMLEAAVAAAALPEVAVEQKSQPWI